MQVQPAAVMALAPVLVAAHRRQIRPGCVQNSAPVPVAALQPAEMVMVDTHPPEAPIHTLGRNLGLGPAAAADRH